MIDKELLQKFLRDECSNEEVETLLQYLEKSNEKQWTPLMREVWEKMESPATQPSQLKKDQYSQILGRIDIDGNIRKSRFPLLKVAASLSGIILLGILAYWGFYFDKLVEQKTGYAETRTFYLPDSSKVYLNSNSEIKYASSWNSDQDREVILKGEAFFEVTHQQNNQRFLVVTSPGSQVEVLGTRFNVNNRHRQTEVVLQSGKVKLNTADNGHHEMVPGDRITYSEDNKTVNRGRVDPENYLAWKSKKLVFEEAKLSEIAQTLHDNYGYKIQFKSKDLQDLTFTGTVPSDKINLLIDMLSRSFDLKIQSKGNELFIESKR